MPREQRRLAAIVSADVAGYSRLMGRDDSGTLAALKALRREIVDPKIKAYRGRIVKTTGDGLLLEFASVVDAVACVDDVQTAMAARNSKVPPDRRIEFRIGVNIGDIIIDGKDIFGDGVNVAARLQELAPPGGICVSGRVYEDVRDKLDIVFEDAGEQQLKNIIRPVRTYKLRSGSMALSAQAPLALPDKPSIAVLPFQNMSGDADQEYFADGVVEEIITALSRFRSLFVIARNSSFTYKGRAVDVKQVGRELGVRYVLEGSVRKAANQVRVAAQLIDATNGAHIWAERFDGALEDVFDLQDRLTERVVAAIAPNVERAEIARARRKPTSNLDAYDCYLHGLAFCVPQTKEGIDQALALFHRAIALDPDFAPAYGVATWCYSVRQGFGWPALTAEEKAEVNRLTRAAVRLGQGDALTLTYASWGSAFLLKDLQSGHALVEQALALNPNLAVAWATSGWINVWLGDPTVAMEHLGHAMRLSPLDIAANMMTNAMAHACFYLDRYDEALSWANVQLRDEPDLHPALRVAAASAAFAGRDELARQMGRRLHAVDPELKVSGLKSVLGPYQKPDFPSKYAEGLRKAGLPE